jgi:tetratricopeptide (TPR) repeat protein
VSLNYRYTIGDIIDSLEGFCKDNQLEPSRTYIWICCLCINQHRVVEELGPEDRDNDGVLESEATKSPPAAAATTTTTTSIVFEGEFRHRVLSIGQVLCLISPWQDPSYFHRLWCLFEAYTAITNKCTVTVIMPSREEHNFFQDVFGYRDPNCCARHQEKEIRRLGQDLVEQFYQVLAATRAENASASFASDRKLILDLIQDHSGFSNFNQSINQYFRQSLLARVDKLRVRHEEQPTGMEPPTCFTPRVLKWIFWCSLIPIIAVFGFICLMSGQSEDSVEKASSSDKSPTTGPMFGILGLVLTLLSVGILFCVLAQFAHILHRIYVYSNLGIFFQRSGEYEKAMECFRQSERLFELQHAGCCGCNISHRLIKYEQSFCPECLVTWDGEEDEITILLKTTYLSMAQILHEQGQYNGALDNYEKLLELAALRGVKDHFYSRALNQKGKTLLAKGDLDDAMEIFQKVRRMHEKANREADVAVVETFAGIAEVHFVKENYPEALEMIQIASDQIVLAESLSDDGLDAGAVFELQGKVYDKGFDDIENGLLFYSRALDIRKRILGENHPISVRSFEMVGMALYAKGDYACAKSHLEKCLAFYMAKRGEEDPSTLRVRDWLKRIEADDR